MDNQHQAQGYPQGVQQQQMLGQQTFHHLLQQQQQQLQLFWNYQRQEIEQVSDFKNHQLPLARIKKIMKADEDVRMISAEAPVLFAKACELFILELTIRSWLHAEENKRRTLQKNDIASAITRTDIFDFLVDIVPRDEVRDEGLALARPGFPDVPYYYPPQTGSPVTIGRPAMPIADPSVYYQQQPRPGGMQYGVPRQPWQQLWQPNQQEEQSFGSGQQSSEGQGYGVSPGP
ncbi:nuclear transcription factor Y subunit C-1-like [Nymphaea colorata]|uniref:nuclear transcription factor Y subunit C-1-like n=1 Tax=Nymphaea colorata TaxID=210225 RepID=UPI00129E4E6E|nr:nuclear transcription factor Y subunit C-1-like [Nymphaea colorata]XP_031474294.1 nuclear transcription factor Y subunit C-1-like [Nymphaea colorata]